MFKHNKRYLLVLLGVGATYFCVQFLSSLSIQQDGEETHAELKLNTAVSDNMPKKVSKVNTVQTDLSKFTPRAPPLEFSTTVDWKRYLFADCVPQKRNPLTVDIPLVMVTASSQGYFDHLNNIVGSIHKWEPTLEIVVYDLGLSREERKEAESWCRVIVEDFPYDQYPSLVKNRRNFAWKALVVKLAVEKYGKILYLDAGTGLSWSCDELKLKMYTGYELRKPIDFIKDRIARGNYFATGMGDTLTRAGRSATYSFFGANVNDFEGRPMTAGGVHGLHYFSGVYENVIVPAAECSVTASCIHPEKETDEVRIFGKDQPVFSSLLYNNTCFQAHMDSAFTAYTELGYNKDEVGRNFLYHRRGGGNYNNYIQKTCPEWFEKGPQSELLWNEFKSKMDPKVVSQSKQANKQCLLGSQYSPLPKLSASASKQSFALITGASDSDFTELSNFVGSVQEFEPDVHILIYDLGLSTDHLDEMHSWCNCKVTQFNWSKYPARIKNRIKSVWKVLAIYEALETYDEVLLLDVGHELRYDLYRVRLMLRRDGFFNVAVGGNMLETKQSEKIIDKMMMNDVQYFLFKPLCSAVVLGFMSNSGAVQRILKPMLDCALNEDCWDSEFVEEVGWSAAIYNNSCYTCNRDYDFYAYDNSHKLLVSGIPMKINGVQQVLFWRRQQKPKPFMNKIKLCSNNNSIK